jgi:ribosomal-protein-alanine N-acetyltransferase
MGAVAPPTFEIRRLGSPEEARACALMMAASEPWITLGRGYEESLKLLQDPSREVYVAARGGAVLGFLILVMTGAFVGYVQTICVAPEERSRGIGGRLLYEVEERVFRDSPNVFLCVSDFNPRARALYERLGYKLVGEFSDYIVAGHSELLFRKTMGPIRDFRKD